MLNNTQTTPSDEGTQPFDISPYIKAPITRSEDLPELPEEQIQGVMRKGDKVMIAGASKSGKTCGLLTLAICFAAGIAWCGMKCAKLRVLFINLEIREELFMHRQYEACAALGINPDDVGDNLRLCNLRGKFFNIQSLVDSLLAKVNPGEYDVIFIDPAYKVQDGIENNADAIARFCRELDRLVEELDCSVIYSHHHSKGFQAYKDALDRASGSGVFTRDGDAIIDLVELNPKTNPVEGVPYCMEFVLRGFAKHESIGVLFDYPCHRVDETGAVVKMHPRKSGYTAHDKNEARQEELADFEAKLDAFIGEREMVYRIEFERASGISKKKLVNLLKRTERFVCVSHPNQTEVYRADAPSLGSQPTHSSKGAQGAASL